MNKIITDLSILKIKSEIIKPEDTEKIIIGLENVLKEIGGLGLSAIQIGTALRVGIIRIPGKEPINLINPIILERSEKFRHIQEGCLSIPGLRIDTTRYKDITIENNGEQFSLYDLEAVVAQHEIDHQNGILILKRKWKKRR